MYARLVEVHGSTIIDLRKEQVLIGRRQGCDVVLRDPAVSAHHCQFLRSSDGKWFVKDLGSKNGTWLNGIEVREAEVNLGDEVWFSKRCRFRLEAPHRGSIA
ncbi:MAG: FHA domain-containing protein [Pirellulaceae bacterium]